ncbi:MAG: nucleotide exchange factor GrpE [Coriobacteriia bacterium]|nr:nucleotide exchange factor GrpE [Coriobacteriia bacterium]MCL2749590.1 nucleotide exchange factor GrpE [Coriobacteriia bacterium]
MDKDIKSGSPHGGEPTSKKHKKKLDSEARDAAVESSSAAAEQEIQDNIDAETEHLSALASALAEAEELRDRHLRLKAEWDNYRRRTEAERADERSRATQRLVEKILPVLDDMERALEHSNSAGDESFKEGIVQVLSKLQSVLESEGVSVINPKGEPFDANLHCALSKVEDKKVPDETVVEVFQKGYLMGSRVLRPAAVVVSHK